MTIEIGESIQFIDSEELISFADGSDDLKGFYYISFLNSIETETFGIIELKDYISLSIPTGSLIIDYFVMRGKDVDCVSLTYRTWTVQTTPDTNGSRYTGTKCGASPLEDIVIVHKYRV